jgi:hypothetical protein
MTVLRNITALGQISLETILSEVLMIEEKFWIFSNRIKIIGAAVAIVFESYIKNIFVVDIIN